MHGTAVHEKPELFSAVKPRYFTQPRVISLHNLVLDKQAPDKFKHLALVWILQQRSAVQKLLRAWFDLRQGVTHR